MDDNTVDTCQPIPVFRLILKRCMYLTDDGHIVADARYDAMIEEGVVSGHAST